MMRWFSLALMILPVHGGPSGFLAQPVNESSSLGEQSTSVEPFESNPLGGAAATLSEALQSEGTWGMYTIQVDTRGISPGEEHLSRRANGFVDLFSRDDASGRQRWYVSEVPGLRKVYNIRIAGGTNLGEEYLSYRQEGFVDLYRTDDGSGRQQWTLQDVGDDWYTIRVYGGTNVGETFLSTRANGFVDLYSHDNGSGRQRWRFHKVYSSLVSSERHMGMTTSGCLYSCMS